MVGRCIAVGAVDSLLYRWNRSPPDRARPLKAARPANFVMNCCNPRYFAGCFAFSRKTGWLKVPGGIAAACRL
ncbi:hypothetical protein A6M21_15300 [Desulfotomaculum copahuensis]|uniref:Uncharacterized protein n=1 Tax=Desulfotomaculum copahuensis TaxID=1838280 RepID=A0A1B7LBC9_9FIRM|nr:hypothetical protein A6M21_15300 [Desulfotomaculum copahuensis]